MDIPSLNKLEDWASAVLDATDASAVNNVTAGTIGVVVTSIADEVPKHK